MAPSSNNKKAHSADVDHHRQEELAAETRRRHPTHTKSNVTEEEAAAAVDKQNNVDSDDDASCNELPLETSNPGDTIMRWRTKTALLVKAKAFHSLKWEVLAPYVTQLLLQHRFEEFCKDLDDEVTLIDTDVEDG